MRNLTGAYFEQGTFYYSESGNALIRIDQMMRAYAANAARRLLSDAPTWAAEAGVDTRCPSLWMINTKLFFALSGRAQSI